MVDVEWAQLQGILVIFGQFIMNKTDKIIAKYIEEKIEWPSLIAQKPASNLKVVVVIPAFKEVNIAPSINSLLVQNSIASSIEIIVIINHAQNSSDEIKLINENCLNTCRLIQAKSNIMNISIHPILLELENKQHGVGLARKIGLDEGVRRLSMVNQIENGLLLFFDADAIASQNYLAKIIEHFDCFPQTQAASIYFEHNFTNAGSFAAKAITSYELHLRCHTNALRVAGLPYAFQTVGSSIAVNALAYIKQGGMNRKQAGEDFYFLNKFAAINRLSEINSTCNYLSSRRSDRVPFGTGKAMHQIHDSNEFFTTYNFNSYLLIKKLIDGLSIFYNNVVTDELLRSIFPIIEKFLTARNFPCEIEKIKTQVKSSDQFRKRFFQWFNPLMNLQLLHYLRDNIHPNTTVNLAAAEILAYKGITDANENQLDYLMKFRNLDRNSTWWQSVHI